MSRQAYRRAYNVSYEFRVFQGQGEWQEHTVLIITPDEQHAIKILKDWNEGSCMPLELGKISVAFLGYAIDPLHPLGEPGCQPGA